MCYHNKGLTICASSLGKSDCGVLSYAMVDAIGNPAKIATGVGGAFIVSTISLGKIMEERGIQMGLGLGGITTLMCDLLEKGLIRTLVDTHFNCNVVVGIIEGRDGTIMDVVREIKEYQFD